jgi:hypothetical protein
MDDNTTATRKVADEDEHLGAVENDPRDPGEGGNVSMAGQLGHRDQDPMIKGEDTDFPGPDAVEEHSGEPQA